MSSGVVLGSGDVDRAELVKEAEIRAAFEQLARIPRPSSWPNGLRCSKEFRRAVFAVERELMA
jgi:hypothetical protein